MSGSPHDLPTSPSIGRTPPPGGTVRDLVRVVLDVQRTSAGALIGTVVTSARATSFHGVMALVAAIERAVDDEPSASTVAAED